MKKILFILSCIILPSTYQFAVERQKISATIEFNAQKGLTGYYDELNTTAFVGDIKYTKVIVVPENSRPKKSKKHEFFGKLTKIATDGITSQEFDMYGIKKNTDPIDRRPDGNVRLQERTEEDYLF